MHEEIKKIYQTQAGMTADHPVRAYAEKIRYPRWKISRYAREQGWTARQKKEPDWTEKELEVLERSAHRHPEVIQRHLKRAGFSRSVTGIILKRKRMRFLQNLGGYSAQAVAKCFGVDQHCITRWINLGWLKAQRRGHKRVPAQRGDYFYIKDKWIRDFILEYLPEIDIRKVDKYWFVDLLLGKDQGCGPLSVVRKLDETAEDDCPVASDIACAVGM